MPAYRIVFTANLAKPLLREPDSWIIGADSTMRSNQRLPWRATRIITVPPMECATAKIGGGQSGSTTSFMKVSRSCSYSEKSPTWPLRGSSYLRCDRPWPRQSKVATAKPRERSTRTVSKYFSMNSARPWMMQTVPLRPGGGCQRAKRRLTPSRVLSMPVTTSSGTGLAGIETRSMKFDRSRAASLIAALGGGDSIADEGDWGEDNLQNITMI